MAAKNGFGAEKVFMTKQSERKFNNGNKNTGRRVMGEVLKAFSRKTRTIFRINRRKNM